MMRAAVLSDLVRVLAVFALGAPLSAGADVVSLKDGEKVEGIVTERGDEVDVRLDFGTITFAKSEVVSIERASNPLIVLEARELKLAERDVEGRYRLGLEAEKAGYDAYARALFRKVLAANGEHKGARAALGYRKHDSVWLTEDEYMAQQGYVRMGSAWVSREAAANIERMEAERRAILDEARRKDAGDQRIAKLEAELAAVKREVEAKESEESQGGIWVPYWNGQGYARRRTAPSAGVTITGTGKGVRGQVQLGGAVPARGAASVRPVAPAPKVGKTRSF